MGAGGGGGGGGGKKKVKLGFKILNPCQITKRNYYSIK